MALNTPSQKPDFWPRTSKYVEGLIAAPTLELARLEYMRIHRGWPHRCNMDLPSSLFRSAKYTSI